MKSVTTLRFRKAYNQLPERIKEQAKRNYSLWKEDPAHPGLHFKQVHKTQPIYSIRVGISYRALGIKQGNTMVWFWIGSHSEYDKLIASH